MVEDGCWHPNVPACGTTGPPGTLNASGAIAAASGAAAVSMPPPASVTSAVTTTPRDVLDRRINSPLSNLDPLEANVDTCSCHPNDGASLVALFGEHRPDRASSDACGLCRAALGRARDRALGEDDQVFDDRFRVGDVGRARLRAKVTLEPVQCRVALAAGG